MRVSTHAHTFWYGTSRIHQDIEEIAELGKSQHACAYYASRGAVANAQLIALPYSMLLHKDTRETLGIDLKGAVVICDEAHNLLDSLSDLHSAELSLAQVCTNVQTTAAAACSLGC
jgi:chromosome transmission fidelity protein 1